MKPEEEIKQIKEFRNNYHKAAVNLIYTGKCMIQFHSVIFIKYHLIVQQNNILCILPGSYPLSTTVKLIRERMLDRMSDASRIVDLLPIKGLVKRNINSSDRRKTDVIITGKGSTLLKEIKMESDYMDNRLASLNKERIVLLNNLLNKASW